MCRIVRMLTSLELDDINVFSKLLQVKCNGERNHVGILVTGIIFPS